MEKGMGYEDGLNEAIKIIEARLPLYTDIGQINALRECISSIKGAPFRVEKETSMVERVGEELRNECLKVFGSTWSYDVAWRFSEVAINVICEKIAAVALDRGDEELGEIIIAALKAR